MKKFFIGLFALSVVGLFSLSEASAQKAETETPAETTEAATTDRPGFNDANGDGVCDNYDGNRAGKGLGPGNGKGEGRATGKGLGRGQGLRDGSGQGLRDGSGRRDGQGRGQRQGLRDGSGPNCNSAPAK